MGARRQPGRRQPRLRQRAGRPNERVVVLDGDRRGGRRPGELTARRDRGGSAIPSSPRAGEAGGPTQLVTSRPRAIAPAMATKATAYAASTRTACSAPTSGWTGRVARRLPKASINAPAFAPGKAFSTVAMKLTRPVQPLVGALQAVLV